MSSAVSSPGSPGYCWWAPRSTLVLDGGTWALAAPVRRSQWPGANRGVLRPADACCLCRGPPSTPQGQRRLGEGSRTPSAFPICWSRPALSANSVNAYVRPIRSLAGWLADEGLIDTRHDVVGFSGDQQEQGDAHHDDDAVEPPRVSGTRRQLEPISTKVIELFQVHAAGPRLSPERDPDSPRNR